MLDSTMELISLAASNPLAVFCFCNLIIAILLVGSSKSQFTEESPNEAAAIAIAEYFKKHTAVPSCEKATDLIEREDENVSTLSMYMVDNEEQTPDQEEEEDGDDDELRKRVEEFIEKINRGWRAEKLKE